MEKKQQYYKLILDDYATPAYISWTKDYYGTLPEIEGFVAALKSDSRIREFHQGTINAFEEFLKGNTEAEHTAAYNRQRLLTPVDMIFPCDTDFKCYIWDHLNTWKCVYRMRADSIKVQHAIFCQDNRYTVGIKARFRELYYLSPGWDPPDSWHKLESGFWGFPRVFEIADGSLQYRMFTAVREFTDEKDAKAFLSDPGTITFKPIIDDIFGDG